ncbi:MAG: hypothetical protein ACF8MF_11910 [Phycisphaerales bacterium JB052]
MTPRDTKGVQTLPNYPAISNTTVFGWSAVGIGLLPMMVGVLCVLRWQGVIGGKVGAPLWVIGMAGVVFVLAGLMLVMYGLQDLRRDARRRRALLTHPREPWRGDYDWSRAMALRGMRSRDARRWWAHGLGLGIVLAMASITNWVAFDAWGSGIGAWFMLIMAFFMNLIAVLVIALAIRRGLMRWRYGSPRIMFDRVPVRPGQTLRARVITRGLRRADGLRVTLRYVIEVYGERKTSHGKAKQVIECQSHDTYEWVSEDVDAHLGGDGTLPIEFAIPDAAPASQLHQRPARFWDLEVHAQMRGVDFVHRFAVPVYSSDLPTG